MQRVPPKNGSGSSVKSQLPWNNIPTPSFFPVAGAVLVDPTADTRHMNQNEHPVKQAIIFAVQ